MQGRGADTLPTLMLVPVWSIEVDVATAAGQKFYDFFIVPAFKIRKENNLLKKLRPSSTEHTAINKCIQVSKVYMTSLKIIISSID